MKKLFIIIPAILIGCVAAKTTIPSTTDVDRGSKKFPGLTLADLNEGKALYEQHCGTCHGLKRPDAYNQDQWTQIVPPMVKKVNKRAGKEVMDDKAKEQVLKYVITMGTKH